MIVSRWRESNSSAVYWGKSLNMSIMDAYSFGLGKIFAISGFLFIVKNEIILEPRHVQSFRLQAF